MDEAGLNPRPAAGTKLPLRDLLNDEELSVLFRDFLHGHYGGENLSFWLAVELFHTLEGQHQDYIEARALDIFAKFIRPRGVQEINIDSERRMQLMLEMSNIKLTLFDGAQREIQDILETDSIPKFRKDPAYIQWTEAKNKLKKEKIKSGKEKKAKKEAKDAKEKKHSLMSKLLGKDHEPETAERGRAGTLDALKEWRKQQHKSATSSPSPQGSTSTSPLRAGSTSPQSEESPLSLSAPNPTKAASLQPPLTASRSSSSLHSAVVQPKKERPKSEVRAKKERRKSLSSKDDLARTPAAAHH